LFRSEPFMALSAKAQNWYIEHATELCYGYTDLSDELYSKLSDLRNLCPGSNVKRNWDNALKCIQPAKAAKGKKTKPAKSAKTATESPDILLFTESETEEVDSRASQSIGQPTEVAQTTEEVANNAENTPTTENYFVNSNPKVIALIQSLTASLGNETQMKIVKTYKYICKEYGPDGYYTKRGDSRQNREAIEHFINYCTYEGNKFNRVIKTNQVMTILNNLQQKLFELYGCTNN
ncbi:MAG: hypothetical protein IIU76_01125, partial [Bacteroidales bacterium]|nr:hypothetical protein [Bacteroidales bacterium]